MDIPNNLYYTSDHEWVKVDNKIAHIGITDFAQSELGDIVFIEFPNINDKFLKGDVFGTIEAVKTVADLFFPIAGTVIEINNLLEHQPELINKDPYGDGWITKVLIDTDDDLSELLNSSLYAELLK